MIKTTWDKLITILLTLTGNEVNSHSMIPAYQSLTTNLKLINADNFCVPWVPSRHRWSSSSTWDDLLASSPSLPTFSLVLSRVLLLLVHQTWWNYLDRLSQRTKNLSTSETNHNDHRRWIIIIAHRTTRGYKANARTLLRRQQLRVRSRRYFWAWWRSVVFVCYNSRFNSVSRDYLSNFV